MKKTHSFVINAPVDRVWTVLGERFDEIGAWATAVPSSIGAAGPPMVEGAPTAGRTCTIAVPGFSALDERLIRYEPENHTLAYEVIDGLPRFVASGVNTWTLKPLSSGSTEVTTTATMSPRGLLGRLAGPILGFNVGRTQRSVARDLTAFVETGRPSSAKRRQLARL